MNKGIVKWFNIKKGFGFITCTNGEDIFFHYSSIQMDKFKTLNEKQKVSFLIKITEKGPEAKNIITI